MPFSSLVPGSGNARVVLALGLSQVTGYGTLYYGLGVIAPFVGESLQIGREWAFGALSISFLAGGLVSPIAGRMSDRQGAGRLMAVGSVAAAAALTISALAPGMILYLAGLILLGLASSFVQYGLAFAALVQIAPREAQRSITILTLIAGFSSTLFWPMTAWLAVRLDWRTVYLLFAVLNIVICLPIHVWLARRTRPVPVPVRADETDLPQRPPERIAPPAGVVPPYLRRRAFAIVTLGLTLFSFVNSSMLIHMLRILGDLDLGAVGVWVSTFFGPAQVMSRFISMMLGRDTRASTLALISGALLPLGLTLLIVFAPSTAGAFAFALVFGMATGLNSIVQGTLPLMLFGPLGYGAILGRLNAVRLVIAAAAPFLFSILADGAGVRTALGFLVACAIGSLLSMAWIARLGSGHARHA